MPVPAANAVGLNTASVPTTAMRLIGNFNFMV
jgi:hypothetical protein